VCVVLFVDGCNVPEQDEPDAKITKTYFAKIKNSVISRKIVHQPETISIYHPISDHYKVLGGG
jgi:hypothetical protein